MLVFACIHNQIEKDKNKFKLNAITRYRSESAQHHRNDRVTCDFDALDTVVLCTMYIICIQKR